MSRSDDEYLRKLLGPRGVRELEEMERLEYLTAPIRQTQTLDQASTARAAGLHLQEVMDDVLCIQGVAQALEPPASGHDCIGDLEGQTGLARAASDAAQNATIVLAETVGLFEQQRVDTITALASPQSRLENLIGDMAQQLEELTRLLPTEPFQDTLWMMLGTNYGDTARTVAPEDFYPHLLTIIETAGLTPWVEGLQRTLGQPGWPDLLEEISQGSAVMSADLQALLTEELYEQPDWRSLFEITASALFGTIDETPPPPAQTTQPEVHQASRWRLKRQFLDAYSKAVERLGNKRLQVKPSQALFGVLFNVAFFVHSCTSTSQEHIEIRRDIRHNRDEIRALQQNRSWMLAANDRIWLRISPFANTYRIARYTGPIRLVEKRRIEDWVEVMIYDCSGEKGSGWVRESTLERLESSGEAICPTNQGSPTPMLVRNARVRSRFMHPLPAVQSG